MSWRLVLGFGGGLLCAVQTAAAEPARSYAYTLEYALSPGDNSQVQRRQEAVCTQMVVPRCRLMLSRVDDGGYQRGALNVEVARGQAPLVLREFAAIVDDAGGRPRLRELKIIGGSGASKAGDTASISVTYVAIPVFAEQTGEALRGFGPTVKAGLVTMIYLLPALAPWLAVAALIVWGVRSAWRRRRRPLA